MLVIIHNYISDARTHERQTMLFLICAGLRYHESSTRLIQDLNVMLRLFLTRQTLRVHTAFDTVVCRMCSADGNISKTCQWKGGNL